MPPGGDIGRHQQSQQTDGEQAPDDELRAPEAVGETGEDRGEGSGEIARGQDVDEGLERQLEPGQQQRRHAAAHIEGVVERLVTTTTRVR
jgi:hypothetical protein